MLSGMTQLNSPNSLLDALLAYEAQVRTTLPQKKANATLAQVRTALWRYTLPAWECPLPQGQRLTQEEYERGLHLLQQLPLERLNDALEVQERLFEQLSVAGNSRRNYRWALKSFINWCDQQSWFAQSEVNIQSSVSRKRQQKPSANDLRLTTRKARQPYRLAESERSEALQQELEKFFQFLIAPSLDRSDERELRPVSSRTAEQYLNQALRILGWLHAEQNIPAEELSLRWLVAGEPSFAAGEQKDQQAQANARRTLELVQAYLQWLRDRKGKNLNERSEGIQSPRTEILVIRAWIAVAQFVYRQSSAVKKQEAEKASTVISALRDLRRETVATKLKGHQPVSDESKKQLEWHEFLKFVETLRGECVPRFHQRTQSKHDGLTLAPSRTLSAIAQSYQRFLLGAFLAYIPPQRSEVLRKLVVSPSPISKSSVHAKEFSNEESVLYQNQDRWWLQIVLGRINHHSVHDLVSIPNPSYPDGRCFYNYLEEWLLRYGWENSQGETIEVAGLRSCFNPQHHRLFTMKNGHPYQDSPAFIKLLRHPAYRITGKALDFDSVRQMYSKYLRNEENSRLELARDHRASQDKAITDPSAPN